MITYSYTVALFWTSFCPFSLLIQHRGYPQPGKPSCWWTVPTCFQVSVLETLSPSPWLAHSLQCQAGCFGFWLKMLLHLEHRLQDRREQIQRIWILQKTSRSVQKTTHQRGQGKYQAERLFFSVCDPSICVRWWIDPGFIRIFGTEWSFAGQADLVMSLQLWLNYVNYLGSHRSGEEIYYFTNRTRRWPGSSIDSFTVRLGRLHRFLIINVSRQPLNEFGHQAAAFSFIQPPKRGYMEATADWDLCREDNYGRTMSIFAFQVTRWTKYSQSKFLI